MPVPAFTQALDPDYTTHSTPKPSDLRVPYCFSLISLGNGTLWGISFNKLLSSLFYQRGHVMCEGLCNTAPVHKSPADLEALGRVGRASARSLRGVGSPGCLRPLQQASASPGRRLCLPSPACGLATGAGRSPREEALVSMVDKSQLEYRSLTT